jgi:hypothetical protein
MARTAWFFLPLFLCTSFLSAQAQNSSCSVSLPVALVDHRGNLLGGATAKDLTVQ